MEEMTLMQQRLRDCVQMLEYFMQMDEAAREASEAEWVRCFGAKESAVSALAKLAAIYKLLSEQARKSEAGKAKRVEEAAALTEADWLALEESVRRWREKQG